MPVDQSPSLPSTRSSITHEGLPVESDPVVLISTTSSEQNDLTQSSSTKTSMAAETLMRRSKSRDKPATKRNSTKLSHQLSLGLRHKALEFGWHITPDGFVPVQQILNHNMFHKYTLRDIIDTVNSNDKQRYTLQHRPLENYDKAIFGTDTKQTTTADDDASSKYSVGTNGSLHDVVSNQCSWTSKQPDVTILCIRANQGHSIDMINSDLLLQRLTPDDLLQNYNTMVHGTFFSSWECILSSGGLRRMKRNHIHFATGLPNKVDGSKNSVISGMRKSCDVYIYVNVYKCVNDNIPIYKSDNGVLLTAGVDASGILPIQYFSHVTDASGNVLFHNTN